jgi:phosphoglucomutase
MSAMLIAEYILSQRKEKNILENNSVMVKSIVSTNLAEAIANEYNLKLFKVLTGFKYIGEKIKEFEQNKDYKYVFGFEESYGCLIGDYARDKDGIAAVMALCEAAAYYKSKGLTLWDQMINIYEKYGYYKEKTISVTLEGIDGLKQISETMERLRNNYLEKFAEIDVNKISDYKKQEKIDMKTKNIEKIDMPESNVLYYELSNDAWVCVRPSGTEPKIKYYIGVKGNSFEDADRQIELIEKFIKEEM